MWRTRVEHIASRFPESTTEHVSARCLGRRPPAEADAAAALPAAAVRAVHGLAGAANAPVFAAAAAQRELRARASDALTARAREGSGEAGKPERGEGCPQNHQ